jgi:ribosome-associated translation inhibitor RaiA
MGRLTPRWRRYWGLRPGESRRPEPRSGPHARGGLRGHESLGPPIAPPATGLGFPIAVVADDDVPESVRAYAVKKVVHVARFARRPVLHARVTLRLQRDPALERRAVVKATLDVSGRSIRAHVAAKQLREAIDLLEERLRRNLEDAEAVRRARRHEAGLPRAGEWRHAFLPTARPEYFPRPREEREVIRRKTYTRPSRTPDEATRELRLLDYDFYLFTNASTDEENVARREPDGSVALMDKAPVLLIEDAIERLDAGGERFVFFVDAQNRRGHVLYRRYDGHYGLLEPERAE